MEPVVRQVILKNKHGLHARPATVFVEAAKRFSSSITLTANDETVDGKSIISMLTLGLGQGSRIIISAKGDDAEEAINTLVEMVEYNEAFNQT